MMLRRVCDLEPGDNVRPFDDRLWHVAAIEADNENDARVTVTFSHPIDGTQEVILWPDDMVRLG